MVQVGRMTAALEMRIPICMEGFYLGTELFADFFQEKGRHLL